MREALKKHHTPHLRVALVAGATVVLIALYIMNIGFRAPATLGETLLLGVIVGVVAGLSIGLRRLPPS